MKGEREQNYDLLRVISMIAVIMIHVSATWVGLFTKQINQGAGIDSLINPLTLCIYNSVSRFAVPCFVMLSGAFILDDDRTADYKWFYKTKLKKICIFTIVFTILYFSYNVICSIIEKQNVVLQMISLVKDVAKGEPFYHMWYLFMLIGLYLMAPVVIRFKDSISYKSFRMTVFVFLILASISRWTTGNIRVNWNMGQSFEYLGYFMTGYVIRRDLKNKNNLKGIILVLFGILFELSAALIEYKMQIVDGLSENQLKFNIVTPYCPLIVAASVLIFTGFTLMSIKSNKHIAKFAGMSLLIYLFHAGVWDCMNKILHNIKGDEYIISLNNVYWIPIFVIIVLALSVILTVVYNRIESLVLKTGSVDRT